MISIDHAQIGYDEALITIDALELSAGKLYVLVGRNGSGKSTFLRTLIGQTKLVSGELQINGHLATTLQQNPTVRAKHVSFVSSMFSGVEALSLRAYVALGRVPHLGAFGRMQQKDWDFVEQTLRRLQIEHLAGKQTTQLSDGEKQLASLARAMVQDTPVMVLDEPTSFLDFFNRSLLLDQLQKWIEAQPNRTVVFSSHDLDLCFEKQLPMLVLAERRIVLIENPTKEKVFERFGKNAAPF